MADSRTKDLTGTQSVTSKSDLTNLYFPVDKVGYTEDKKFDILSLIVDTAISDADTTDYKFITPKALKATIASTTRFGIVRTATQANVEDRIGSGVMESGYVNTIISEAQKDFTETLGIPTFYHNSTWGCGYKASFYVDDVNFITLNPTLPSGKGIGGGTIAITITANEANFSGFYNWESGSADISIPLSGDVTLEVNSNRTRLRVANWAARLNYCRIMIDVNYTYRAS
jgi:hypothetical protein